MPAVPKQKYEPLILQKLDIRIPGIRIRQMALHRHLPETAAVQPHSHPFAQCLLYLTGRGEQQVSDRLFAVQAGTAVFLPPRVEHAFGRKADRPPVCLVVDFDWRAGRKSVLTASLAQSALREIRQHLAAIARLQRPAKTGLELETGALILKLLALLLDGLALRQVERTDALSPGLRRVERLLNSPEWAHRRLGELARRAGYQRDYLNRLLKAETGLTLGQFRARSRVRQAQQALEREAAVGEASVAAGFEDANYFSRWFRKQTGQSPTAWRRTRGRGVS